MIAPGITTGMATISVYPTKGFVPYEIHMRNNAAVERTATMLLRCGFRVGDKHFAPKRIKRITITTPDGVVKALIQQPMTAKAAKRAKLKGGK